MVTLDKIAVEKGIIFVPSSILVALLSLTLTILAGFCPDLEFQWYWMAALVVVTIAPMPVSLFVTYRKSRQQIRDIKKFVAGMYLAVQDFGK